MDRPVSRPSEESPEHLLIVEGQTDWHAMWHLRQRQMPATSFCIEDKDNDSELIASIVPEVRVEDRKALGILIDANDDLSARWDAISDRLGREGITVSANPDPNGTIIETPDKPRVGIWLMPDNQSPGELEDFIRPMIPTSDPVWPLSKRYVDGIPKTDRKFPQGKILKAQIHSWLAVRSEPRPMGRAITTGDLEVEGELCQKLMAWLRRLFG